MPSLTLPNIKVIYSVRLVQSLGVLLDSPLLLDSQISSLGMSTLQFNTLNWPTLADSGSWGLGCRAVKLWCRWSGSCWSLKSGIPQSGRIPEPKHLHCSFTGPQSKPHELSQLTWANYGYLTAVQIDSLYLSRQFILSTHLE